MQKLHAHDMGSLNMVQEALEAAGLQGPISGSPQKQDQEPEPPSEVSAASKDHSAVEVSPAGPHSPVPCSLLCCTPASCA